jgi:GlcNAc-P-P-Und epimerase
MRDVERVLVTGGSGFIGTRLVDVVAAGGAEVVNLDVCSPRDPLQTASWRPGNVLDETHLSDVCQDFRPTLCVHLAAETEMLDTSDIDGAFPVNSLSSDPLMHALAEVGCRHAVMTSTQFVCGPASSPPQSDTDYAPHTSYGESKVRMERSIRGSRAAIDWTIVRPTYVWGPWHLERFLELARTIQSGRYLHPGGPAVIRSYGYVNNVVAQLVTLLGMGAARGRTLYLGEESVDSKRFVDALSCELAGRPVRTVPRWVLRCAAAAGDVSSAIPLDSFRYANLTTDYRVDMTPTFELVGAPAIPLDLAAREYAEWLRRYDEDLASRSQADTA